MTDSISDKTLAELKAGLKGVTPGPWFVTGDAAHISRCDPQTIAALIARLEQAERERDEPEAIAQRFLDIIEEAKKNFEPVIAARVADAVQAEREACAQVAEANEPESRIAYRIAAAIRGRE